VDVIEDRAENRDNDGRMAVNEELDQDVVVGQIESRFQTGDRHDGESTTGPLIML
jgi:hypothetical protein